MAGTDRTKASSANILLQRVVGAEEPHSEFPCVVGDRYACFSDKLETTLKEELDNEIFDRLVRETRDRYELRRLDDALKNPVTMTEILMRANDEGTRSATLDQIVEKIFNLALTADLEEESILEENT